MRKFGLIGNPLSHSFSASYFKRKFEKEGLLDVSYEAFELQNIEEMFDLFEQGILGLNVTIPFKESVIPFLDELDELSNSIMAVNTIKNEKGLLKGYNTDVLGFISSMEENLDLIKGSKALILGTGGSSKAVAFALDQMGINYHFVSRSDKELSYKDLNEELMQEHKFIINTTPLGMYPQTSDCPSIPYEYLSQEHLVYDLIYNPEKTLFLTKAEQRSARIQNGMDMLRAQAEKSWEIWNSKGLF